ncbi:hypothetical protein ACYOEI_16540 [Singulisphaera rosea]
MKNGTSVLLVAALALPIVFTRGLGARAQGRDAREDQVADVPQDKSSIWMKHKLDASQKILEGMTRADYKQIEKNARSMKVMAYLEGYFRADMPGYKAQLHAFENANEAIVRAAQEKNLDGATIAYTQLTISCVSCHKLVRDKPTPTLD